jgi:hypothetical protein
MLEGSTSGAVQTPDPLGAWGTDPSTFATAEILAPRINQAAFAIVR